MRIFFIIIVGLSILDANKDMSYLYQNYIDIKVNILRVDDQSSVKVKKVKDKKLLIDTRGEPFFIDKSKGVLDISYNIISKVGGFDINYKVKNSTNKTQLMPDFQVPGILLSADKTLDILNTNTKHYMEKRDLDELRNFSKNYFSVSAFRQIGNDGNIQEEEKYYGGNTLSPYSPVITAKDIEFAVGTSLNYPILKYEDNTKRKRGRQNVLMNKLYPKMRIYKDDKSWTFKYSFDKYGVFVGRIGAKKEYEFTIPVRFSKPKSWLFTMHPYKEYFLKLYETDNNKTKDVSPIMMATFSFYGDSVTEKSKRGWSWALENVDKDGYSYMPLKLVSKGISLTMAKNGYKRIIFGTFSGVYNANISPLLYNELPFQFITNLEPNMEKELNESLAIYKKAGQKFGFWWGIAGMMPIDEKGDVISFDTWQPHSDTPFIYNNPKHRLYALRQLKVAKDVKADSLSLDAYVRMEENSRLAWLQDMKELAPKISFYTEEQVDFMHTKAAILLQPENVAFGDTNYSKNRLTKPAVFSHYLNPNKEVQVWLIHSTTRDKTEYVKRLVSWGYTPIIPMPMKKSFNHDERNVTKRILDNADYFIPVTNLDNSKIVACFDGIDNDGDGKIDWPYDEGCTSSSDDSELKR